MSRAVDYTSCLCNYSILRDVRGMYTSDRLIEVTSFYVAEARRCSKSRAYLAASIMQSAALEAVLQAMCCLYPEDVKTTIVYQHKRFRGRRNKALEFSLN